MTDSADDQPHRLVRALVAARSYWDRHSGLDGVIRVGGAVAVVVTIEALAGYFLWRGTTESVRIPATLGWSLQFGLTGGSVVGTRAFHRGHSEDKWWGLATSLVAVLFVVADASMAALLLNDLVVVNPGLLAVGVLVECLVIGYLTVHTLMAAPRAGRTPGVIPVVADEAPIITPEPLEEWGPPDTVTDEVIEPVIAAEEPAPIPEPEPEPEPEPDPEPVASPPKLRSVTGKRTRTQLVAAGAALTPAVRRGGNEKIDDFRERVEAAERVARRDRQAVTA